MIEFIECKIPGYEARTAVNVLSSDITIAFANDFTSGGEKLTKLLTENYKKVYVPVPIIDLWVNSHAKKLVQKAIIEGNFDKINIAGNGLYTLKHYTQKQVDDFIWNFMSLVLVNIDLPSTFTIRSGGQTGVDEAGLKFGDEYGCRTICYAPKNWLFRNADGKDVPSLPQFIKRFGEKYAYADLL